MWLCARKSSLDRSVCPGSVGTTILCYTYLMIKLRFQSILMHCFHPLYPYCCNLISSSSAYFYSCVHSQFLSKQLRECRSYHTVHCPLLPGILSYGVIELWLLGTFSHISPKITVDWIINVKYSRSSSNLLRDVMETIGIPSLSLSFWQAQTQLQLRWDEWSFNINFTRPPTNQPPPGK